MLLDPDGEVTVLEHEPDLLLGLDPSTPRADHVVELVPGATVVLYTDGLIERRGVPLDAGLHWLAGVLAGAAGLSVQELCDVLLSGLAGAVEDDVALLVVRTHAEDAPRPPEAGEVRVPDGHSALSPPA
jgi:serine phosphatase RsbU (regulator of sigma subunit)